MSNIAYDFSTFTVTDYKGDINSLSSYNLNITPLTFTPKIPVHIRKDSRVVWDFGDGTVTSELVPSHVYERPGEYKVQLFVLNGYSQALLASDSRNVYIKEYLEDTFNISTVNNVSLTALNGQLTDPFVITQTLPIGVIKKYNQPSTVDISSSKQAPALGFLPGSMRPLIVSDEILTYTENVTKPLSSYDTQYISSLRYIVSGSNTTTFHKIEPNIYNHLKPYNSIIRKDFIPSLSAYELLNVSELNIPLSAVYVNLVNNTLTHSLTSNATSVIVGYSGSETFYYRDDLPADYFNIFFFKPTESFTIPLGIALSGVISENLQPNKLSITSNGHDGDSEPLNTFNISNNKFVNTNIHFVVKIKDSENNTVKNFNNQALNNGLVITLSSIEGISPSSYTVTSLFNLVSGSSSGGVYRGYITYTDSLTTPLTGVVINAQWNSPVNLNSIGFSPFSGNSNTFSIFPNNYYTLYKKGEDFDAELMFKGLRFQETLLDKDVFFTDFLGTIFGNVSSSPDSLGKKIYEKIQNFNDNITNINTSDISRFLSLGDMINFKSTVFDKNLINFPNKIQRIVALLSINKDKLFGFQNKFIEDFNSFGHLTKDVFGKNLGESLDINTSTINPSANIVCYEKFSRRYKILNTYQPLCGEIPPQYINSTNCYNISSYNNTWGWPLVLPQSVNVADLTNYYTFFELSTQVAGDIVGGVLDLNLTNIDYNTATAELTKNDGIYENIIANTLIDALRLTK